MLCVRMFPQCFPLFPAGNVSRVSFCFQDASCAYATEHASNSKKFASMSSEHSSNFCKQFEQGPTFASTFKFNGTIRYPSAGKIFCPSANMSS